LKPARRTAKTYAMSHRILLTLAAAVCMIVAVPGAYAQLIVAHRGASFDAPENTLAAFRLAWEQGADGAEGDFYLTADGKIACIHDPTTKRTTGGAAELEVAKTTLDELRKLDVGSWKNAKYAGERIPTLEEALALVPPGKLYYIEIKCGPEILPALEAALAKLPPGLKAEQLRIISFKADVIAGAKKRMPHIKAHWISGFKQDKETKAITPKVETVFKTLRETSADGFNGQANLQIWTPEFMAKLKDLKLETAAWTVDDPAVARTLTTMGIWGITTNKPGWLREQLKTPGQAK
jgi:glycerophosphoryl diester phosphodiesterase